MDRIRPSPAARRAPRGLVLLGVAALGIAGCGESVQPPSVEPASAAPPVSNRSTDEPPPAVPAPAATTSPCRVSPLGTLAAPERVRRLTLLPGPTASGASETAGPALIVEGVVTELLRLTPSFTLRSRRALPTRVEAAIRVGAGIVALAAGPADPVTGAAHYRALRLAEDPQEDAELLLPVAVQPGGAVRRSSAGEQVVFTWTDARRPPLALRLFSGSATRLRFDAVYPLTPEIDLEEGRAVQLLRVALDSESFAAIIRVGSAEGIGSEVLLTRPSGPVSVHALEDIADIEAMAIVGDEVWVIATYEFSRPLLLRIAADGELVGGPVELARDATLPAELDGGDPARLLEDGARLLLRRRNPMGDPLLPDALVAMRADQSLPADVLREAQRYVVVYQDRDEASGAWPIRFASLDCAPR